MARFFVAIQSMPEFTYDHLLPSEAVALQKEIQQQTRLQPLDKEVETIGGADISFNKYSNIVYAGIVVLRLDDMSIIYEATTITKVDFPYVPGLLAFREVPALVEVWEKLEVKPDVLVLDGHGIGHPRRMGIATHFGIVAGTPTLGCAKSLLVGNYDEPENIPFASTPLMHGNDHIGMVLRTKKNCKPVYVSPGHMITMDESVGLIKMCIGRYRIPEPTRQAHLLVNRVRSAHN